MKRFLSTVLLVFVFAACDSEKQPQLSPDKMQAILSDIHVAEVYSIVMRRDSAHRGNERNHDSLAAFYHSILKHHNVDLATFDESLNWYKRNPDALDSVYAKMIPEMAELEVRVQ